MQRRFNPVVTRVAAVLLFCTSLLANAEGQSSRLHGTVRATPDSSPLQNATVVISGEKFNVTLVSDRTGAYQIDLPGGTYTMTVNFPDPAYPTFRRPLFRVPPSTDVVIDVSVPLEGTTGCDIGIRLRQPKLDPNDYANACGGSVLFPAPSKDGIPFEVLIRFGRRESSESGYVYSAERGANPTQPGIQVLVAYNLFTLLADHVTYDARNGMLAANGHVNTEDGDGKKRRSDSMTFEIANGKITPVPQIRTGR